MFRAPSIAPLAPLATFALTALLVQSTMALAADPVVAPDAGQVLRDNTTPLAPPVSPNSGANLPEADATIATPQTGLNFVLKELRVKGSSAVPPEQINQIVAPYVGKSVADKELSQIIASLRRAYEDKGLGLVGLGFPSQDVSTGVVTIDAVEPRLGKVQTPLGQNAPISADRVQGLLKYFNVHEGQLLNIKALDRALFALNDLPGVQAKGSMSPAGDEGVYNLTIQVQARRAWDASLTLDNHGSEYTGLWRLGATARWNNPLSMGDNLDVRTMWSTGGGVKVGRLAYETPVGYTPLRWSMGASQVDYALGGTFADLDAHGTARVLDTALTYPLIRARSQTLVGRFGYETKGLVDLIDLTGDRNDKRIRSWSAGLSYEARDSFLGGGFLGGTLQARAGHLSIRNDATLASDLALGDRATAGSFNKFEAQVSRLQALSRTWSLYAAVNQQWASKNLDSAERMTLGGPNGVRSYASSEGASDQATLLTSELRYWIDRNWTVFGLYDWGHGRRAKVVTDSTGNHLYLRAMGLGLSMSYPKWATVKATVAWRGHTEPTTDTKHDQPRLFLQAQHSF